MVTLRDRATLKNPGKNRDYKATSASAQKSTKRVTKKNSGRKPRPPKRPRDREAAKAGKNDRADKKPRETPEVAQSPLQADEDESEVTPPREGGDEPDDTAPVTVAPRAAWAHLPLELRTKIYDEVGTKYLSILMPGSQDFDQLLPASYVARLLNSGLDSVNSSIFHELRPHLVAMETPSRPPWIIVHWDCVDQLGPLLRMVRHAREAEAKWVEKHGNVRSKYAFDPTCETLS